MVRYTLIDPDGYFIAYTVAANEASARAHIKLQKPETAAVEGANSNTLVSEDEAGDAGEPVPW